MEGDEGNEKWGRNALGGGREVRKELFTSPSHAYYDMHTSAMRPPSSASLSINRLHGSTITASSTGPPRAEPIHKCPPSNDSCVFAAS